MAPIGKKLHLRLFLEGIEVPVISASVMAGINAPSSASIQVIPLDSVMRLHARTMVHLFYLDNKITAKTTKVSDDETQETREVSRSLTDYKLLFAGEMIGYQFQQTPSSRAVVLQCLDFSSYWDTAHATALEYGPGGNAFTHTGYVQNSNTALFDDIVNQQANRLAGWLDDRPLTPGLNTVSGLAGGVIRIMEVMGGIPNVQKGVNDFFSVAELRCRFMEQVTAEENDNTAANLMRAKVFDEWLRNGLQNIGQNVTFRDLMKLLFRYVYYELVPNPVSKFTDATTEGEDKRVYGEAKALSKHPYVVSIREKIGNMIVNANSRVGMGAENRDQWSGFWGQQNRYYLKDMIGALKSLTSAKGARTAINELTKALNICDKQLKNKAPEDWKPAGDLVKPLQEADKALSGDEKVAASSWMTSKKVTQRLHSQILRPDCWFSAPPVCNVLFPEHYVTLSYDRNYLGETTRCLVQLYNTLIDPNPGNEASRLLSTKILAPSLGQFTKSLTTYTNEQSYRLLMDHELHTGIVSREDWVPNTAAVTADSKDSEKKNARWFRLSWGQRVALFNFFKYRFANRQASVAGRFNPNIVCGFPAAVIRAPYYPQDSGQLLSESDISSDPQAALSYIAKRGESLGAPAHIVGLVGSVTHNIDQQGGTTSITMHHVRHHIGDEDEFMRIAQEQKTTRVTRSILFDFAEISKMEKNSARADLLKFLRGLTPQNPVVKPAKKTEVTATTTTTTKAEEKKTEVSTEAKKSTTETKTETATKTTETKAKEPPKTLESVSSLVQDGSFKGKKVHVPTGSPVIGRGGKGPYKQGEITAVIVHNDGAVVGKEPNRYFQKVEVVVEYEVSTTDKIPAEEIMRPRGWFSPKYANSNIGKEIYTPFFGCQSVIDPFALGESRDAPETLEPAPMEAHTLESGAVSTNDEIEESLNSDTITAKLETEEAKKVERCIETSLNLLAYFYGKVKSSDSDVESFIQQYTYRPVATMEDILGSDDMEFTIDPTTGKATLKEKNGVAQRVGFHTQSVHAQLVRESKNIPLAGLVTDLSTQLSRVGDSGHSTAIPGAYDVRYANQQRVLAYANALRSGKAFIG